MGTVKNLSVNFLLELPVLLVALTGFAVGMVYLRRSTAVAVLAVCASLLYLLQALVGLGSFALPPRLLMEHDWESASVVMTMHVMRLFQSLTVAVSLALFLAATFKGRKAAPKGTQQV
jgi:hypothetical protein